MTGAIITSWLISLDLFIEQTPGRKIVLLLDSFKGYSTVDEALTELQNITIHFFSPNTTSRIQILDAGIIAAFKKHYRARQYANALLRSELGGSDIYKLDFVSAIRLSQQVWEEIGNTIIRDVGSTLV